MFSTILRGGKVAVDLTVDRVVLGSEFGETVILDLGEVLADVVGSFGEEVGGGGEEEGGREGKAEEDVSCVLGKCGRGIQLDFGPDGLLVLQLTVASQD